MQLTVVTVVAVIVVVAVVVVGGGEIHQTFEANYNVFFRKILRGYFQGGGRVVCEQISPFAKSCHKNNLREGSTHHSREIGFCNSQSLSDFVPNSHGWIAVSGHPTRRISWPRDT